MKNKSNFIRNIIIEGLILIVYIISYIFFIASFLHNNGLGSGVFGAVLLACFLYIIIRLLTIKRRIKVLEWIEVSFNFVSFLILLVAFIASIESDNLRNTLIPIAASAIGGLITLFGVAITIKYNRIAQEEQYLRTIRPHIFIISDMTWRSIDNSKKEYLRIEVNDERTNLKRAKENKGKYKFNYILIGSSDISMCSFYGILINKKYLVKFEFEQIITKESRTSIEVDYCFAFEEKMESIDFVLGDMLANLYLAETRFSFDKSDKKGPALIHFDSLFDIKKTDLF